MLPFSFELIYQDWCCLDGAITSSHCSFKVLAKYFCPDRYLPLKKYMIQSLICAHLLIHIIRIFLEKNWLNYLHLFPYFFSNCQKFCTKLNPLLTKDHVDIQLKEDENPLQELWFGENSMYLVLIPLRVLFQDATSENWRYV